MAQLDKNWLGGGSKMKTEWGINPNKAWGIYSKYNIQTNNQAFSARDKMRIEFICEYQFCWSVHCSHIFTLCEQVECTVGSVRRKHINLISTCFHQVLEVKSLKNSWEPSKQYAFECIWIGICVRLPYYTNNHNIE